MADKTYLAIDLKSFYASVECVERGLDPLTTNLVVADLSRTEKTICLAVTPSLKAYGISGRARLFEVVERVKQVNADRLRKAPGHAFTGSSSNDPELKSHPELALDYLVAPPRMKLYMDYSARVFEVYLKYIAPEDIHPYSIDEVFMDVTNYLSTYGLSPRGIAERMIQDVLKTTGITATAGIGSNLYLCKVAMDIVAKHIKPDQNGVRIAQLNEHTYRQLLWDHRPLTDFWRIGRGYARKLEAHGLHTMGDIVRCSVGKPTDYYNEKLLYQLFGVNAELLIDHAWGWEPCTIADIKAYKPEFNSIGSGQVLQEPYSFAKAKLVVCEMADQLALDLVDKGLVTKQLTLTVGYDRENLQDPERRKRYHGAVTRDPYGREIPRHAHGTVNLEMSTDSAKALIDAASSLFDRIVNQGLLIRRLNLTAVRVLPIGSVENAHSCEQLDLFSNFGPAAEARRRQDAALARERKIQAAMLDIKKKYGKNAILKGMNLEDGATARERNRQVGGHHE